MAFPEPIPKSVCARLWVAEVWTCGALDPLTMSAPDRVEPYGAGVEYPPSPSPNRPVGTDTLVRTTPLHQEPPSQPLRARGAKRRSHGTEVSDGRARCSNENSPDQRARR